MMRKKRRLYSSLSDLDKQKAKSMYLEWRGLLVPRHSSEFAFSITSWTLHLPPAVTCPIRSRHRRASKPAEDHTTASAAPLQVRQHSHPQKRRNPATRRTVSATRPRHTDASEHPLQALFHLVKQRQHIRLELLISLIGFIRWGPHTSTSSPLSVRSLPF